MLSLVSNAAATSTQRHLAISQRNLQTSLGRLASGLRIVRSADDAAGLAISESLRAQLRSLAMARRNSSDGISLAQTAEGALNEVHGMLMRMRELAVQSANGTMDTSQRTMIHDEFASLRIEIDRIAETTEFNGMQLLSAAGSTDLQVGIDSNSDNQITVLLMDAHASTLASGFGSVSLTTVSGSRAAMDALDVAINNVSTMRGGFGTLQNRLEVTINRLHTAEENLGAAESRIRDADIAHEATLMSKNQILMQAGVAMLGQANQLPAAAMSLIGG